MIVRTHLMAAVLVLALVTAGCTGIAGNPLEPAPVIINSAGEPGWIPYANAEDRFSVSKPYEWDVASITKATLATKTTMDLSLAMERFVLVCDQKTTCCVMIFGAELSNETTPLYEDAAKTRISDGIYHKFLKNLESSSFNDNSITIGDVVVDPGHYLINGNPARHAMFNVKWGSQSLPSDCYIIGHGTAFYAEWYTGKATSTPSDAATAAAILRTFNVTA
jgi:hypothetical protein